MSQSQKLHINGKIHHVTTDPKESLLSVLRDSLDLTGAKYGCGEGQCGACTVLVDGRPTRACITPVSAIQGKALLTVEGLEQDGILHPVQEAFLEADALQCGYCTSGMILTAVALLRKNPHPTRQAIVQTMQGNVCRCGTYLRIIRAVQKASSVKQRPTHTPADQKWVKP